jgi:diguanylate cyclase (GGDEF)-like protein/putative nucleotidyltransferase with HDIG domain
MPPLRLAALVVPVCLLGAGVVAAAAYSLATGPLTGATVLSLLGLLAAQMLAERYPVPIDGVDSGGVSLSFVFIVATVVLFGWAEAALLACIATSVVQTLGHRPPIRVAFNTAVLTIAGAAAGLAIVPIKGDDLASIIVAVGVASLVDHVIDMFLIAGAISLSSGKGYLTVLRSGVRVALVPFALMSSAALMLIVLWQRSPFVAVVLIGPLLAIALYQRSQYRMLSAMRLALTDPLTNLGNHRHFHERLQRELTLAEEKAHPLSLALVDIDDFKRINDRFGHPAGDGVLGQVGKRLRQGGEAFRLGGDEFALLLPGLNGQQAFAAAASVVDRCAALDLDHIGSITVSAGVATYPVQGVGRDELIRLADSALYWAKEHGKNQVRMYRPDVVELAELRRLAAGPDRAARYRAAASLAKAVDARDAYTGSHSQRVGELAARIAERMGAEPEQIELLRLAGSLHDLGKLAIPEEILRKPAPLTDAERMVLERHPQIGFRMLESLGVDPVAEWVLHHHERWDGCGYPDGILGHEIPLGARVIFVADAYDAMTTDRVYRRKLSSFDALAELERCSGSQFDPEIVAALADELNLPRPLASLAS